ncbi:uncharacterized protein LOC124102983 [Marmota monax]|uniref:uncharacterized protein LOC124102983 n=1 Tax=Marmota monax TaxID=9995 RepID=UPI0026E9976E|nr:uncharacterized protein LOC124102983 [Marmota monax]
METDHKKVNFSLKSIDCFPSSLNRTTTPQPPNTHPQYPTTLPPILRRVPELPSSLLTPQERLKKQTWAQIKKPSEGLLHLCGEEAQSTLPRGEAAAGEWHRSSGDKAAFTAATPTPPLGGVGEGSLFALPSRNRVVFSGSPRPTIFLISREQVTAADHSRLLGLGSGTRHRPTPFPPNLDFFFLFFFPNLQTGNSLSHNNTQERPRRPFVHAHSRGSLLYSRSAKRCQLPARAAQGTQAQPLAPSHKHRQAPP